MHLPSPLIRKQYTLKFEDGKAQTLELEHMGGGLVKASYNGKSEIWDIQQFLTFMAEDFQLHDRESSPTLDQQS